MTARVQVLRMQVKSSRILVGVYSPSRGGVETGAPGAHWPVIAEPVSSRLVKEPVSNGVDDT